MRNYAKSLLHTWMLKLLQGWSNTFHQELFLQSFIGVACLHCYSAFLNKGYNNFIILWVTQVLKGQLRSGSHCGRHCTDRAWICIHIRIIWENSPWFIFLIGKNLPRSLSRRAESAAILLKYSLKFDIMLLGMNEIVLNG